MNLPVPCSEPPRRNCPVRASWKSTVKREKHSNQSIEDGRPLLVDRPHHAAGNASRRVQGRVDVLLHIAHETKENMLTVDVDGQVIKRVAHLAREVLRSHHESTESVATIRRYACVIEKKGVICFMISARKPSIASKRRTFFASANKLSKVPGYVLVGTVDFAAGGETGEV